MTSSRIHKFIISCAMAVGFALSPVALPGAWAEPIPTDRAGLDAYIRDYLMNNPDVLRDALLKLERDEQTANTKRVLSELKDDIYGAGSPELGNPSAKVTIVEFYDYNCPYCRAAYQMVKSFIKANPDTKVVMKDIASLGKTSEGVSRVVIAATLQGKFAAMHDELMGLKGQINEERALDVAKKLGLDMERLKKDAASPNTGDVLTRAQELADRLSVTTTPLYLIGHSGIAGVPEDFLAQLTAHVEAVRKTGCEVC